MNKEELFLKFIDDQLSRKEKDEVEAMLSASDANKQLFEKVKSSRDKVLNNLDLLNPMRPVMVPPFEQEQNKPNSKKSFHIKLWHYAAMAAILIGIYFGLKLLNDNKQDQIVEALPDDIEESKTIYKELDCYISPNRCWNQKQLVWTIIEKNH